jgi:hypothetical protein
MYGMYMESTKVTGGSMCRCAQPSYSRHVRNVGRPSALYRFPPASRWATGSHVQHVLDCARATAAAAAAAADLDDGAPPRLMSMGSWGSGLLTISKAVTDLRTRIRKSTMLSLQQAMADEARFSALTEEAARLSAGRRARGIRGGGRGSVEGMWLDHCPSLEATSVSSIVSVYVRALDGPPVQLRVNSTDVQVCHVEARHELDLTEGTPSRVAMTHAAGGGHAGCRNCAMCSTTECTTHRFVRDLRRRTCRASWTHMRGLATPPSKPHNASR